MTWGVRDPLAARGGGYRVSTRFIYQYALRSESTDSPTIQALGPTPVMVARCGRFAEMERDLLEEGRQAGLQAAKGQGPFRLGHRSSAAAKGR